MTRTQIVQTARILASATALCFACLSVAVGADAQTNSGSVGASLEGGGMSAGGSGSGPSGTTSDDLVAWYGSRNFSRIPWSALRLGHMPRQSSQMKPKYYMGKYAMNEVMEPLVPRLGE
jgi:hypothetical protein